MKAGRWLAMAMALAPAFAVCWWTTYASSWPEPWLERARLAEVSWSASWLGCTEFVAEPVHLIARWLHCAVLSIPGATFAHAAWLNSACAVATMLLLGAALRRSFALSFGAAAGALGLSGLLVGSPAHGLDWLHGERVGMFLPPLLLLLAAELLARDRRMPWRMLLALLAAALAPFCHTHGVAVAVALVPMLAAAAARTGSARGAAWIAACLLLGNVAAAVSLRLLPAPIGAHPDLFASLRTFVTLVGDTWGDPLANTRIDQEVLGGGTLVALLGLVWAGDRSGIARDRAAPWWSCALFGLLVLASAVMRYGDAPPSGTWREATYGAFLLPLGVVGVTACRLGVGWLRFCAGAAAVLLAQDWHRGIEDLRLARAEVEQLQAAMALPPAWRTGSHSPSPMRNEAEVAAARARGHVPAPAAVPAEAPMPAAAGLGRSDRGDANALHGQVRSTLVGNPVHAVAAFDLAHRAVVLATAWPDFDAAGRSRDVPWTLRFATPLAEGTRLRLVGYRPGAPSFVSLGADLVLRDGALVPEVSK